VRPIKFRAWHKRERKMLDWQEIQHCHLYLFETDNDLELMQFTGLLDCNGVEIFEGDIFRAPHDFGPGGWVTRTSSVPTDHHMDIEWQYWDLSELQVIGNIHERRELIEE